MLDRRRPGQSAVSTPRKESDRLEILSGVFESRTTGTPIGLLIRNEHQHSADYNAMKDLFRPSHADYTYYKKYGVRDHRGGGRSSARETAVRVAGGAIARQVLPPSVRIVAYVSAVGGISLWDDYTHYDLSRVDDNIVRCPDAAKAAEMEALIREVRAQGDSVGGVVTCVAQGVRPDGANPFSTGWKPSGSRPASAFRPRKASRSAAAFPVRPCGVHSTNDLFTEGGRHLTTVRAACRAASPTAWTSSSEWPSNPLPPSSKRSLPSTSTASLRWSKAAAGTIPASFPVRSWWSKR